MPYLLLREPSGGEHGNLVGVQCVGSRCRNTPTANWVFGATAASRSADAIVQQDLNSKEWWRCTKRVDSKTSRVAISGLYSKGTDA